MNHKISIIMSVYNCEETIRESIDSILAQTYTEWEFVICNDCSTDGTQEILDDYKQRFPERFILIRNQTNMRLAYSLNQCLQYVTGYFVARMDGDDYCAPDRFEKQIRFLESRGFQHVGTWQFSEASNMITRISAILSIIIPNFAAGQPAALPL